MTEQEQDAVRKEFARAICTKHDWVVVGLTETRDSIYEFESVYQCRNCGYAETLHEREADGKDIMSIEDFRERKGWVR